MVEGAGEQHEEDPSSSRTQGGLSKDCRLWFEYRENNCSEKYFQVVLYLFNMVFGGRGVVKDIYFPSVGTVKV